MRMHLNRWVVATALTAVVVTGTAASVTAAEPGHDHRRLQAAVDDLHSLGFTGVQGLTEINGDTSRARAGLGDIERGTPVPLGGSFRMGSATKTFVAVVVLQLVGERKLSLDDTVERWLPGTVAGHGNDGRRVTVRQLLQHTSGIYDYLNDITMLRSYEEFRAHRFDHHDAADLVAQAMKHEPDFAPGTRWKYSNTNYVLAGMLIERVTGRSWANEVQARILRPLQLHGTVAPGDGPSLPAPHAKAYHQWSVGGPLIDATEFNPTVADASGSLITTPSDLARFWQALQGGQLLKPRQMAQMHDTVLADTFQQSMPGARYGLGILYLPNRCGGYWSHTGDALGVSTRTGVSGDGQRVTVLSLTAKLADRNAALAADKRTAQLMDEVICGPA